MQRIRRWRVGAAAVLGTMAALGALTVPAAAPAGAADTAEGRISLPGAGMRLTDTRAGIGMPSQRVQGGVDVALPTGMLVVTVLDPVAEGDAELHPCAVAPTGEPTFRFRAGAIATRSIVSTPNEPLCLRFGVAAHLIIDRWGDVAATPFVGGLQYVARPEVTVYDALANPGAPAYTATEVNLGRTGLTSAATGGVYLIEKLEQPRGANTGGWITPYDCASPGVAGSILNPTEARNSVIATIPAGTTSAACLGVHGTLRLRVTLLGEVTTSGPDPMALPPSLTTAQTNVPAPGLIPINPTRVLNTRTTTKLAAGATHELSLAGFVSRDTTAVSMNVTVVDPDADGYLTVWPCDQDQPTVSNLNFERKVEAVPNLVTVKLGTLRNVCIFSTATTHVLADLAGTFESGAGSTATALTPNRILNTRAGVGAPLGKVAGGSSLTLQVTGTPGIPAAGVSAVTMNVTVTGATSAGYVTVWPCDQTQPDASNLNFAKDQDIPNLVTVKLSESGTVCLFTTATTDLLADVSTWYSPEALAGFVSLAPKRILDTRNALGVSGRERLAAQSTEPLVLQVAGVEGVPSSGAVSVTMNVTAVDPQSGGYLTVWPCDEARPDASNLNFARGDNTPNQVVVKLSAAGTVCIWSFAETHVLADVAGYSTAAPVLGWAVTTTDW